MRTLSDLTSTDDPAWPLVQQWLAAAPQAIALPVERARAGTELVDLQVTLRSPMGAVAYHTGGILIDHGWLRILGGGSDGLRRSISSWNVGRAPIDAAGRPTYLLVADDVLGGFFALNGGGLQGPPGHVFYLAPDTLQWEDLSVGYTDFLRWALSPGLDKFYRTHRWPNWQAEASQVRGDQAFAVYPFLWAEGPPIELRARQAVPVEESYSLMLEFCQQLGEGGTQT